MVGVGILMGSCEVVISRRLDGNRLSEIGTEGRIAARGGRVAVEWQ